MKKTILLLALVGVALAACEKKDEPYQFKTGEVYLNGVEQPKFKSTTTQHSLYEIVREPDILIEWQFDMWNSGNYDTFIRGFDMWRCRDTINNRLLMSSNDILTAEGELIPDFIYGKDVHLRIMNGDTVGYIPQSVIDNARVQIETLYEQERYDEIYELFHTAFTFFTCTGQEYKDIMARGGN